MTFYLLLIFAYWVGSIPFGLLLARFFADVDIRQFGSKNIGATNVNRVLGRKLGAATLLCDMLKGALVVLIAMVLNCSVIEQAWVGFAAFFGHCFPIYLRFRGGKGVATAFGVLLPISIYSALIALGVWITVVRISKISALGALVASLVIPICIFFLKKDIVLTVVFTLITILIVYRHQENIRRLKLGKEHSL